MPPNPVVDPPAVGRARAGSYCPAGMLGPRRGWGEVRDRVGSGTARKRKGEAAEPQRGKGRGPGEREKEGAGEGGRGAGVCACAAHGGVGSGEGGQRPVEGKRKASWGARRSELGAETRKWVRAWGSGSGHPPHPSQGARDRRARAEEEPAPQWSHRRRQHQVTASLPGAGPGPGLGRPAAPAEFPLGLRSPSQPRCSGLCMTLAGPSLRLRSLSFLLWDPGAAAAAQGMLGAGMQWRRGHPGCWVRSCPSPAWAWSGEVHLRGGSPVCPWAGGWAEALGGA